MSLHTRVAIVTGASRGLGLAVAQRLSAEGAHLVLAARDEAGLHNARDVVSEARAHSDQQVLIQQTDVSRVADVELLVARAAQITGNIDVLVSNAGVYGPLGRVEDLDWNEWVRTIEINLFGTVLCCRAVLPAMREQGKGKIIILSGGGATQPLPRFTAYAASKAAVVRFAETLAEEVKDVGIDVNAVAPGALNTRLLDEVLAAGPDQVGSQFYERAVRQQQEGGTPVEVGATLIAFLASSASDGVTGRLISAVWDDWQRLPDQREQLASSDVYTLRRIVPQDRGWNPS
jgi:NAD(P)-dependent dehydrogenase (short-subunit alcohol dehydrogenase family)